MENLKEFHYTATHDHENDTELHYEYCDLDSMGLLTLEFHHEDADVGTETMYYNGEEASLLDLVKELHEEIFEYIECMKKNELHMLSVDVKGYYEDFTTSSLYAFNNILYDVIKKLEKR